MTLIPIEDKGKQLSNQEADNICKTCNLKRFDSALRVDADNMKKGGARIIWKQKCTKQQIIRDSKDNIIGMKTWWEKV